MNAYIEDISNLTRTYNEAIRNLESSYRMDKGQSLFASSGLKRTYSQRYSTLRQEYLQKRRQLLLDFKTANPQWASQRKMWARVLVIALILAIGGCTVMLPTAEEEPVSALASNSQTTLWNASNIPMPHLQDANQYVSNPDHVLTQQAVDTMNVVLQRLDKELGIESAVIVVNNIENGDPFRMAQDVGNKYGVGRDDRGLMVVVGYLDHKINISPGRKLEADLTDAECGRLERTYVVPAMRAEQPDSGMIYLTKAIYSVLQKKDIPVMSQLSSASDDIDDEVGAVMGITVMVLIFIVIVFFLLNRKYYWMVASAGTMLLGNPFAESGTVVVGGGGYGRGGGFSGGGSIGGSFGGGSFGGGGATSSW